MGQKVPFHPPGAPIPAGPYTPALAVGEWVFVSGQTAEEPGTDRLVQAGIEGQTRQVLENIRTILHAAGCTMADVVKVTAHLADIGDFAGYNAVYQEYFPEPYPTRTTVQSGLPGGALVEIDVIAIRSGRSGQTPGK